MISSTAAARKARKFQRGRGLSISSCAAKITITFAFAAAERRITAECAGVVAEHGLESEALLPVLRRE